VFGVLVIVAKGLEASMRLVIEFLF
jgi:hypothetical protein